jgi:cobaltochelatase CobS subunit
MITTTAIPPWREIPSGHLMDVTSLASNRPATALLGAALGNHDYTFRKMACLRDPVRFCQNALGRPLCVDPENPAWIGFVYALMASAVHAGFSFEERRAFARAGFTAVFAPDKPSFAMNFTDRSAGYLVSAMDYAIGHGHLPAKTRKTFAGLRDAMSLPALINMLCMATTPEHLLTEVLHNGHMVRSSAGEAEKYEIASTVAIGIRRGRLADKLEDAALRDAHGMNALDYIATLDGASADEIISHVQPKHREAAARCLAALIAGAKAKRGGFAASGTTTGHTTTPTTTETKTMTEASTTSLKAAAAELLRKIAYKNIPDAASTFANYIKADAETDGREATAELTDIRNLIQSIVVRLRQVGDVSVRDIPRFDETVLDSIAGLVLIARTTETAWAKLDTTEAEAVADNKVIHDVLHGDEEASEGEAAPVATARPTLAPDPKVSAMLDAVLSSAGLPSIEAIDKMIADANATAEAREVEIERLRAAAAKAVVPAITVAATTGTPTGHTVGVTADKLFAGAKGLSRAELGKLAKLTVPTFEWDGLHPLVPTVEDHYIFRMDSLLPLLFALVAGKKPWIQGHTGSGKSTLVMQVAARLKWPVVRVNFDSDISRLDLVGRDTLTTDPASGTTITKWVDGVLPMALRGPHILLLDEIDFVRPDVSYVLQPILEGNPLVLNENGGERVIPDPMFRIVATANTVGQGDEFGMYQGARPQSAAMLDRFSSFIKVPYLSTAQEIELIQAKHPTLDADVAETIGRYVTEHREAFGKASILMPISPRGIDAVAEHCVTFTNILGDARKALSMAFDVTLLAKASEQDRAVISGLLNRVRKGK